MKSHLKTSYFSIDDFDLSIAGLKTSFGTGAVVRKHHPHNTSNIMKKATPFCWKKDSCKNEKCKFIHPRDSENIQSQQKANTSTNKRRFGSNRESSSSEFSRSANSQDINSHRRQSIERGIGSHHLQNSKRSEQKATEGNITAHQGSLNKQNTTQLELLCQLEENAIKQHRETVANIKDEILKILLSDDYSVNYKKQQANIRILQGNIVDLESHILIFDSVKSRAYRELSTKPKELYDQILREIYRFACRLGAFAKRLDIEKFLTSGHRFLIIQGQTGSGKSTQIPQYLADHPRFYRKKIICTQPRKLAAISVARRVSFEYTGKIINNDNEFSYIGYQVGGDKRKGKDCRIEFVTEGIMLERIMKGDMNTFKDVGCIIIDEAHERSIICDLLLGSFKTSDPRWNDILVIVTSATIDLNLFSEYFNDAPAVQIEGRTFPVDVIYQPVTNESEIQYAVAQCAFQIHENCKSSPGDILCFLPGLEDLLNATSIFERKLKMVNRNSGLLDVKVFTLYGKQDADQQAKVFEKFDSTTIRKIIFATGIAETSITIDGIVFVVDSGVTKEIVFDPQRNISSLKINCISKSSAIQRAGRSGRTQPGTSLIYALFYSH